MATPAVAATVTDGSRSLRVMTELSEVSDPVWFRDRRWTLPVNRPTAKPSSAEPATSSTIPSNVPRSPPPRISAPWTIATTAMPVPRLNARPATMYAVRSRRGRGEPSSA